MATGLDTSLTVKARRAGERVASISWIWIAAYILAFLPLTVLISNRYPFVYDEIYTVYLSNLPGIKEIWQALVAGADIPPPMLYVTTRLADSLFGHAHWAIRLPETLGVLLMGVSVLLFVARRTNPLWGFVAAMFILLTGAYTKAYEARPYGLLLASSGTAMLAWQSAAEGVWRKLSLAALALSLIFAISSHYYAILLFVPIATAELIRDYTRRKIDWPIWCSLGIASPTLLFFLPLLHNSLTVIVQERTTQVKMSALWTAYKTLDSGQVILAVFFMFAVGLFYAGLPRTGHSKLSVPAHETAAALGLLALPLPAMALALLVTHNLTDRYVLPLTIGGAIAFAFVAHWLTEGSNTAALVLAAGLSLIFAGHAVSRARETSLAGAGAVLTDPRYPDLPIVVSSGVDFAPAWYYAPPELRSRLLFVSSGAMAYRYLHNDQSNLSILFEARYFHWPVQTLEQFRSSHRQFLLNWRSEDSWLLPAYRDLGASFVILAVDHDTYLYLVTDDHPTSTLSRRTPSSASLPSSPYDGSVEDVSQPALR